MATKVDGEKALDEYQKLADSGALRTQRGKYIGVTGSDGPVIISDDLEEVLDKTQEFNQGFLVTQIETPLPHVRIRGPRVKR